MENSLILDGHKLNWHMDKVNAWLNGERIAPITIDCSLTANCSYRCVYCYGKLQRINNEKPLDKDTIFRFLDDAAEIGVKAISFISDGESTCSPHLYDAIIRGKANGMDMALGTNGYLLKDERLEEILALLTYLRFNISAAEKDRYTKIHGCNEKCYEKVINTIKRSVDVKKKSGIDVTIGMQMVLLPDYQDQILPLARLGKELGVDYLVIKHCGDDEEGSLGVDYQAYDGMIDVLKEAEALSDDNYIVQAKWSKILSQGKRRYKQCYGAPFILQISGSGLVAACGSFFNDKYQKYHIGNIRDTSFKELWSGDRYWKVMNEIASCNFNAQKDCAALCLQHKVNEYLWEIKHSNKQDYTEKEQCADIPMHVNFI